MSTTIDCTVCGKYKAISEYSTTWQVSNHVCDGCYSEPTIFVARCGISRCSTCGELIDRGTTYYSDGSFRVCEDCYGKAARNARNTLVGPFDAWHNAKAEILLRELGV